MLALADYWLLPQNHSSGIFYCKTDFNYSYHTSLFFISNGPGRYLFSGLEFEPDALTADIEFCIDHLEPPSVRHCLSLLFLWPLVEE